MCRVKVLFWRNPVVPLRFSRVSASFRYMAMCRVFQKRTRCVAAVHLRAVYALLVFAFRRRVRVDVFRAVCTLFVVCASVFSKNASKPTSSWSVVVFRHCIRVDVLRTVCTLFVVCASVFQKMHPNGPLQRVSLLSVAMFVSPFSAGDLRSLFLLLAQCFSRKRKQAGVFRARFFLLCVFDVFVFRKPPRMGVCGSVLACFYIVCVSSFRQRAVSTYSDRFCREDLHRAGLYGLALPG